MILWPSKGLGASLLQPSRAHSKFSVRKYYCPWLSSNSPGIPNILRSLLQLRLNLCQGPLLAFHNAKTHLHSVILLCFQNQDVGDSLLAKFSFQPETHTCQPLDHTFRVLTLSKYFPSIGMASYQPVGLSAPSNQHLCPRRAKAFPWVCNGDYNSNYPIESLLPVESSQARPSWFAPFPSSLSLKLP